MTAPTTRATPKIALDQRAASRHDTTVATTSRVRDNKKAVNESIWLMKGVQAA
jgi:hypothetical protein